MNNGLRAICYSSPDKWPEDLDERLDEMYETYMFYINNSDSCEEQDAAELLEWNGFKSIDDYYEAVDHVETTFLSQD